MAHTDSDRGRQDVRGDVGGRAAGPLAAGDPRAPASASWVSKMATVSLAVAVATLALALAGAAAWSLDLVPLVAQGMLIVAIGGTILGVTLSAIGLMTTRHRPDPVGRRRAWLAVGICCALLAALLIAFAAGLGGPVVVSAAAVPAACGPGTPRR